MNDNEVVPPIWRPKPMQNPIHVRLPSKLLAIGATAIAVMSVSAGAMSLALFTDDAVVDSNSFATGTINLTTNPSTALFSVSGMMPGDSSYGQLTVSNAGSAQLRYAMTSSSTDPDNKALAGAIDLEIRVKAAGTCSGDFTGALVMTSTALSAAAFGDPNGGQDTGDRVVAASANEVLCFKATLPQGTGDGYQGAATVTTFTFRAEQTANNS